jgi:hypothetical protein
LPIQSVLSFLQLKLSDKLYSVNLVEVEFDKSVSKYIATFFVKYLKPFDLHDLQFKSEFVEIWSLGEAKQSMLTKIGVPKEMLQDHFDKTAQDNFFEQNHGYLNLEQEINPDVGAKFIRLELKPGSGLTK